MESVVDRGWVIGCVFGEGIGGGVFGGEVVEVGRLVVDSML